MCFFIPKNATKQIAIQDIECYKYGYYYKQNNPELYKHAFLTRPFWRYVKGISKQIEVFDSPVFDHIWFKNKLQPTVKLNIDIKDNVILDGYHAYTTYDNVVVAYGTCPRVNIKIGKFIIPKGAEYYHNPEIEQYVATQMIFIDFIE